MERYFRSVVGHLAMTYGRDPYSPLVRTILEYKTTDKFEHCFVVRNQDGTTEEIDAHSTRIAECLE